MNQIYVIELCKKKNRTKYVFHTGIISLLNDMKTIQKIFPIWRLKLLISSL